MSNINTNNITSTNITTNNLNVTTINGVPIANIIGGYYPCPSCNAPDCDPDVGCGECSGCADFVPDACDCYIAPSSGGGGGGAGAISTGSGQSGASGFVAIRYRL